MKSRKHKKYGFAKPPLAKLPPEQAQLARERASESARKMLKRFQREASTDAPGDSRSPEYDWSKITAAIFPSLPVAELCTGISAGDPDEMLGHAFDALADGNLTQAARLTTRVLQSGERNVVDRALRLIQHRLGLDDNQKQRQVAEVVEGSDAAWLPETTPSEDPRMIAASLAFITGQFAVPASRGPVYRRAEGVQDALQDAHEYHTR